MRPETPSEPRPGAWRCEGCAKMNPPEYRMCRWDHEVKS